MSETTKKQTSLTKEEKKDLAKSQKILKAMTKSEAVKNLEITEWELKYLKKRSLDTTGFTVNPKLSPLGKHGREQFKRTVFLFEQMRLKNTYLEQRQK